MTLAEAIAKLREYDEEPFSYGHPAILVAEPWEPGSFASVEWVSDKGGVPLGRKPMLLYLTSVRKALEFFGDSYDEMLSLGEVDSLCRRLITRVLALNGSRRRRNV